MKSAAPSPIRAEPSSRAQPSPSRNIDTGETKDFITNKDGIYDTVSTPAGNYNVTVTAKGFKKFVRGPITLQVDVITEDAALEVGAISETVTVEANGVPLLETETGYQGTIFEKQTIGRICRR